MYRPLVRNWKCLIKTSKIIYMKSITRWIPVSERLPDKDTHKVQALLVDTFSGAMTQFTVFCNGSNFIFPYDPAESVKVTHWHYLLDFP